MAINSNGPMAETSAGAQALSANMRGGPEAQKGKSRATQSPRDDESLLYMSRAPYSRRALSWLVLLCDLGRYVALGRTYLAC